MIHSIFEIDVGWRKGYGHMGLDRNGHDIMMNMLHGNRFIWALSLAFACQGALAASDEASSRGEMLYSTHCVACHTTQVHWREQRLATDWGSLVKQVRRWETNSGLNWNNEDINDVARYLNALYYQFPEGAEEKVISGGVHPQKAGSH